MDLFTPDPSNKRIVNPQLDQFLSSVNRNRDKEYLTLLIEPSGLLAYEELTDFISNKYNELSKVRLPFLPEWQFTNKAEGATHVTFRPRWGIPGAKSRSYFVIEGKHISILALTSLHNELQRGAQTEPNASGTIKASVPGSDFEILRIPKTRTIVFRRKPGALGESLESIQSGSSAIFHTTLRSLDPDKSSIVFYVYADSFDTYYAIREFALQARFDVSWVPMKMGVPLQFYISPDSISPIF
jgi:hypothetical protein